MYKAERSKERLECRELVQSVDAQYQDIIPLLQKLVLHYSLLRRKKVERTADTDYDRLHNELAHQS